MYDKCYFCLDQLPKLKKESTASFFENFGGAGVQKSRPTLLYSRVIKQQKLVPAMLGGVCGILVSFGRHPVKPLTKRATWLWG